MALSPISETIKIFFSLAPTTRDRDLFEELRKHLSGLKRLGLIDLWYDSAISAGSNVKQIIEAYMSTADIIVLLISADFFDSEQCYEVEMKYALEQSALRAAPIIPVLLRPIEWEGSPLERYQFLPPDGRAVSAWDNLDIALLEVAKGIRRVVEDFAGRLTGARTSAKRPQFPLYIVPYRRNPFFTDREDLLIALHRSFTSGIRTQALHGLGGMGKTLLAMEYARRYQQEYQAVLWLNAASHELLSADLLSLTDQLGIPAQERSDEQKRMTAFKGWLQHHNTWLLVLDNLEDFTIIDQLVPHQSGGHVLLTTHSQATGPFASAVSVTQMTSEDGALLLLRRAKIIPEQGSHEAVSEADYSLAMTIAQEFAGYPLALDQAGAYIEETQRDLASYLARYRQQRTTLLGMRGRLANEHPDPVTTTLLLTFEKLAQIDSNALELLYLFAFLHPDALPDEMIMHGAIALDDPLRTLALNPVALDTTIATLRRFSLIHHYADTTMLRIHRIVQTVLSDSLTTEQQRHWASQVVLLLHHIFPEGHFNTWDACERYLLQAQHCATLIATYQLTFPETTLLLQRLGTYCYRRGRYTEAETYLIQALHLHEQREPLDVPETAQTLNSLGLLAHRQANYQQAEAYHQRALAMRERAPGPDDSKVMESLHNLARLYERQGKYQQAEQFYLRVLSLVERTRGTEHPQTAKTLNNLALTYYRQGNYSQAEIAYRRALTIYERTLPANHPDLTYPLNGLGALSAQQARYQQAEQFYQRTLAIREQTLGDKHPETAHSINKLADIYESQGKYQQAEALYQRALAIAEQALKPEHPDIALILNNLGFLANKQERYQQAEQFYQRALSIYKQALGDEHPFVASVLNNLGQLARNTADAVRAEAFLRHALAIRTQALGAPHSDTAQSLNNLAELLLDQDNYAEAEQLFQQALAIRLQVFGSEHPEVVHTREQYASLLERTSRSAEAAQLRRITQPQEQTPEEEEKWNQ